MTTNTVTSIQQEALLLLEELGVQVGTSDDLSVHTPITGEVIARIRQANSDEAAAAIKTAHQAHLEWRMVPAPKRGELVRIFGEELRANLPALGRLVTLETGKILSEGRGEVQEMIDICGFATGLSRQLSRPYPSIRASRTSDDGNLASTRGCGRHFRFQLSRCCLGMECRAGPGMRQCDGLETVIEDTAYCISDAINLSAGGSQVWRNSSWVVRAPDW